MSYRMRHPKFIFDLSNNLQSELQTLNILPFIYVQVQGDSALTMRTAAVRLNPPSAELRVRRFTVKLWQTSNCILTTPRSIMNTLRIARAAVRARPAAIARPIQRRGYAEVASDKIKLSLALPHQVRIARVWHT
jgi:hypothetical protein